MQPMKTFAMLAVLAIVGPAGAQLQTAGADATTTSSTTSWSTAGDGNWNDHTKWDGPAPCAASKAVLTRFENAAGDTQPYTVTVPKITGGAQPISSLLIDLSATPGRGARMVFEDGAKFVFYPKEETKAVLDQVPCSGTTDSPTATPTQPPAQSPTAQPTESTTPTTTATSPPTITSTTSTTVVATVAVAVTDAGGGIVTDGSGLLVTELVTETTAVVEVTDDSGGAVTDDSGAAVTEVLTQPVPAVTKAPEAVPTVAVYVAEATPAPEVLDNADTAVAAAASLDSSIQAATTEQLKATAAAKTLDAAVKSVTSELAAAETTLKAANAALTACVLAGCSDQGALVQDVLSATQARDSKSKTQVEAVLQLKQATANEDTIQSNLLTLQANKAKATTTLCDAGDASTSAADCILAKAQQGELEQQATKAALELRIKNLQLEQDLAQLKLCQLTPQEKVCKALVRASTGSSTGTDPSSAPAASDGGGGGGGSSGTSAAIAVVVVVLIIAVAVVGFMKYKQGQEGGSASDRQDGGATSFTNPVYYDSEQQGKAAPETNALYDDLAGAGDMAAAYQDVPGVSMDQGNYQDISPSSYGGGAAGSSYLDVAGQPGGDSSSYLDTAPTSDGGFNMDDAYAEMPAASGSSYLDVAGQPGGDSSSYLDTAPTSNDGFNMDDAYADLPGNNEFGGFDDDDDDDGTEI